MAAYRVSTPAFDGPLDLLLQLIERNQLDITTISLATVADQFLDHLRSLDRIDPEQLTDFVVVAAKLLLIKSEALLPKPTPATDDADDDVGSDLTGRLLAYEQFRRAAAVLRAREEADLRCRPRIPAPALGGTPAVARIAPGGGLGQTTLPMLQVAYQRAVANRQATPGRLDLPTEVWTVRAAARWLVGALTGGLRSLDALLAGQRRARVVATFLATLELGRAGLLRCSQAEPYGEIAIEPLESAERLLAHADQLDQGNASGRSAATPARSSLQGAG